MENDTMKKFITKLWCQFPHCWYYTTYGQRPTKNGWENVILTIHYALVKDVKKEVFCFYEA